MSDTSPICFLSDFGLADDFVGLCKGVMVGISPAITVVDLTHYVPGFGVESGAEILAHATRYMPENTVYLAVVDPGVGTERRALALRSARGAYLVGPDNGLLIPAVEALGGVAEAVVLTNPRYHLLPVSGTFHGRDIFAPAAAHLAGGLEIGEIGESVDPASLARVDLPGVERLEGGSMVATVIGVDRYGNVRLSVDMDEAGLSFGTRLEIESGEGGMPARYVETFGHSKAGDLALVPDSHRCLSLSVNRGNASRALSLGIGDRVVLAPLDPNDGGL